MDGNEKTLLLLTTNLLVLMCLITSVLVTVFINLDQKRKYYNRKYPGINIKEYK